MDETIHFRRSGNNTVFEVQILNIPKVHKSALEGDELEISYSTRQSYHKGRFLTSEICIGSLSVV